MKKTVRRYFTALSGAVLGLLLLLGCGSQKSEPLAKHVIIIGVDGMSPDGVRKASTPNMDQMMQEGAFSMVARGVLPTVSSPNWASLIMGASPAQHGVTSNDWRKDRNQLPTQVSGTGAFFPTIFKVAKDQRPELKTAIIYDWGGFGNLFDHSSPTHQEHAKGEEATTMRAVEYIKAEQPNFLFVHLDHVDHAGHSEGHGTSAYYEAVEKADLLIGQIKAAVEQSGMAEETVIIITADHGGIGKGHGGESLAEQQIPWIAWGKNIRKSKQLKNAINTYDTPATAAYLLNIRTPQAWIGRPVLEAIEGKEVQLNYYAPEVLQQPEISPKADVYSEGGGLFVGESATLKITNRNQDGIIRYTTDGQLPGNDSPIFEGSLDLTEHTVIQAAIFKNDSRVSQVSSGYFRFIDRPVGHGLAYKQYETEVISQLPVFSNLSPVKQGTALEPSLHYVDLSREEQVAIVFEGYIKIETEGDYRFFTRSDDGSKLYINNQQVVNNDGDHGITEQGGNINLSKGMHSIRIAYFNGGGGSWLGTYYQGPEIIKQPIPGSMLFLNK